MLFAEALAAFGDAGSGPASADAATLAATAGERLAVLCGTPVPVLYARQEHTSITFVYGAERPLAPGPHLAGICDGLITAEPGVALLVRTADCLPVALAGDGVVAMVHAGWRGLARDILAATVHRLRSELGVAVGSLSAAIGVGIGPCHYRVGTEVHAALERLDAGGADWRRGEAVDLGAFAAGRLRALGVPGDAITRLPGCTACSPTHHSHRRDGAGAGRQWSAIVRREARGTRRETTVAYL